MDVDAYLRRVGFTGGARPTLETLRELQFAHVAAIPFENLSPLLGEPVRLDEASLEEKLVRRRRGGWCFEHNLLLAHVLRAMGLWVEAEAALRKALALQPSSAGAQFGLGETLRAQHRHADAEAAYRKAIALQPNDAYAYHGLGEALAAQDRGEEAKASYRRALAIDPAFAQLRKNLAIALRVSCGKMMASVGLKVDGKIFAMVVRGSLVVKLPKS